MRQQRGFPLHEPPHMRKVEGWYLITAACYQHRPIFDNTDDLTWLTNEMLSALTDKKAHDLDVVSKFLRKQHSRIATSINGRQKQHGRRVWYRFSDRLIRSERHYCATVNYVHFNPVKHGYVKHPDEWSWSSMYDYLAAHGSEWLGETIRKFPLGNYGKGWDWGKSRVGSKARSAALAEVGPKGGVPFVLHSPGDRTALRCVPYY